MENEPIDLGPRKKSARDLARNLIKDSRVSSAPVSLREVIEYLQTVYSLDVRRVNLSQGISGLLVVCREVDQEYATIGFNENHSWCRRRFTIAHEIGHLLMGHTCNKNSFEKSHNETEANIFAAELLIPKQFLKSDFKRIQNIPALAKFYLVSQESLGIKLGQDGLLR